MLLGALGGLNAAHAGALLKPVGQASQDLQPRAIDVQAKISGATWKLRLWTGSGTDRVTAFLPWKARVALQPQSGGEWGQIVNVPPTYRGKKAQVRFVVTDSAHNRSELFIDWN